MPRKQPQSFELDERDASLFSYALERRLKTVKSTLQLLLLTRERDLTQEERLQLSPTLLAELTREELQEQIDSWISLRDDLIYWIKKLDPRQWPDVVWYGGIAYDSPSYYGRKLEVGENVILHNGTKGSIINRLEEDTFVKRYQVVSGNGTFWVRADYLKPVVNP